MTGHLTVRLVLGLLLAAAVGAGVAASAAAKSDVRWRVKGLLLGPKDQPSENISGIACATARGFPRACLVIDDNLQQAQFVTVKDGEIIAGGAIPLIDNTYKHKPLDLDGEGVAYANGFYYVIGSHGHPRHRNKHAPEIAARIAASSQIVRFRPDGDSTTVPVERTAKLRTFIAQQPELAPYLDRRLEDNGLTIEGVAVRQERILVGFRGPSLSDGRAAILSLAVDSVFGNAAPGARLYRLALGEGQGVRDLALFGDGVLVLAGPSASGPGPYAIYWWDGESEDVKLLKDLAGVVGKKGKRKPEALLPLDESASTLRVLVLFDGPEEGAPVGITIPRP
jgi:Protein of unknown function (DUF3616)